MENKEQIKVNEADFVHDFHSDYNPVLQNQIMVVAKLSKCAVDHKIGFLSQNPSVFFSSMLCFMFFLCELKCCLPYNDINILML